MSSVIKPEPENYQDIYKNPANKGCGYKVDKPLVVAIGIVLTLGAIAGALAGAYHLSPNFQVMLNGGMSIADGLLHIAVPVVGASLIIGIVTHALIAISKRRNRPIAEFDPEPKSVKKTIQHNPRKAIAAVVLAVVIVAAALICTYVPAAHQWMHNTVLPTLQSTNIPIWQALAYIGGSATGLALITGLVIHLLQRKAEQKKYTLIDTAEIARYEDNDKIIKHNKNTPRWIFGRS